MKFVCDGLDLSDAVLKVIKAVSTKTTNPILEGMKIVAKEDRILLTATDLELTIEKTIHANVMKEGEAVVPGRYFSEFVKKLNSEQIEINLTDKKELRIRYADSEGKLNCMDESEYPEIYTMEETEHFVIKQGQLKELINKVIFSVGSDDSRPVLKGCLIEVENNNLVAVALDGYRLALVRKKIERSSGKFSVVVPARSLSEISKLLSDNYEENIVIKVHKNYLMVERDDAKVITRLIDGEFINYRQIIPEEFTTNIAVSKDKFENGLERASIMSRNEKNNLVKFEIKEKILLLTSNSEIGNIMENIPISMHGRDISIAFNSKYYTECLKVINEDYVKIYFNSNVAPCVIKPVEGDEYLYLILPVRINAS